VAARRRRRIYTAATAVIIITAISSGLWLLAQEREADICPGILPGGLVRIIAGKPGEELNTPLDVAAAPNGRLYVADAGNGRVQVFSRWGRPKGFFGGKELSFSYPNTVAVDVYGQVYVGEFAAGRVMVFTAEGKLLRTFDARSTGVPVAPLDIALDDKGRLLIADRQGSILILNQEGRLHQRFDRIKGAEPETLAYPNGIAVDPAGRILVADTGNRRLLLLSPEGRLIREIEGGGLTHPRGVAFFGERYIVVADTFNSRLVVFDLTGKPVKNLLVKGELGIYRPMPNGLCVHQGRVYVADRAHHVVLVYGREAQ